MSAMESTEPMCELPATAGHPQRMHANAPCEIAVVQWRCGRLRIIRVPQNRCTDRKAGARAGSLYRPLILSMAVVSPGHSGLSSSSNATIAPRACVAGNVRGRPGRFVEVEIEEQQADHQMRMRPRRIAGWSAWRHRGSAQSCGTWPMKARRVVQPRELEHLVVRVGEQVHLRATARRRPGPPRDHIGNPAKVSNP